MKRARGPAFRKLALVVHCWVGLAMAAFLIVAGVTGSLMAFYPQLDRLLNPELLRVDPPESGTPLLDPFELRERALTQLPHGTKLNAVSLQGLRDAPVNYWIDGRETFFDPYTGKLLGARTFGKFSEGRKTFATFVYRLHFSLALDEVGILLFGIVSILWTIDCFVGAYLTFPLPARTPGKSWVIRWWPAWLLKTSKLFSLVFTWHRASGLWVWLVFLMFAWSGVALNLREQVYDPVMHAVFGANHPVEPHPPDLDPPRIHPKLSLRDAYPIAKQLMAAEAERRGFRLLGERWLGYEPEHGSYSYTVESTLDLSERLAETHVVFDGDTGQQLHFGAPTGEHLEGTIGAWLIALHFGAVRIGGLPYRIFVCAMGVVVSLLSVTGVWIWLKKRKQRQRAACP